MKTTYGLSGTDILRRVFICLAFLVVGGGLFIEGDRSIDEVLIALIFIGAGMWILRVAVGITLENPRIELDDEGVTFHSRDYHVEWDWDEFIYWFGGITNHNLYGVFPIFTSGALTFYSENRPSLSIKAFIKDAPELINILITEIIKRQLPIQIRAFNKGKTLDFGSVTLNKEGLRQKTNFVPFDDLLGVKPSRYYLWVYRKTDPKNPLQFEAGEIKSPQLLLAVVQTLIRPSQAQ